ncbi:NfeD family protein [Maricaulis sp. CAU 1757]
MAVTFSGFRQSALAVLAAGLASLGLGALTPPSPSPAEATDSSARAGSVHAIPIDGIIGPATTAFVSRSIAAAENAGAEAIILTIDTPGGLVDAMRAINLAILASEVPVIAHVAPSGARAASAGTYILYASHLAAMAPGATVGAATPVSLGPSPTLPGSEETEDDEQEGNPDATSNDQAMRNKVVNDSVAALRALAELRGRNADWAEQAVREGVSVTAREALELGIIEIMAESRRELLTAADGRTLALQSGASVTLAVANAGILEIEPSFVDRFLAVITNPNIAFLLINVGVIGLIASFYNGLEPVTLAAGVLCLIVGFYGLNTLPVNYAGVALILFGLGLLVAEAFVVSYGVLALAGTGVFALGAMMLVDTEIDALDIDWRLIAGTAILMAVTVLGVVSYGLAAQRRGVSAGRESLTGMTGPVLEWSGMTGFVHIDGERWQAVSPDVLGPGDTIEVAGVEGLLLTVRRRTQPAPTLNPQGTPS